MERVSHDMHEGPKGNGFEQKNRRHIILGMGRCAADRKYKVQTKRAAARQMHSMSCSGGRERKRID